MISTYSNYNIHIQPKCYIPLSPIHCFAINFWWNIIITLFSLQRLARKMTTFGVDFHKHLKASKRNIPIIVTKCINEIDERGLDTQGLYRISSAKTKLEHLCQLFESGIDRVDLSDRPCHLIGSCLKLYFRQVCVCV